MAIEVVAIAVGLKLADHVLGKALDRLGTEFKSRVIDRWTRQRADEFVRTFCALVLEGVNEAAIDSTLDELLRDDNKSAALFDAYRRISFCASPSLGPRVIALVTAKVVAEVRKPSTDEEQVLAAAQLLNDGELTEARDWFVRYVEFRRALEGPYTYSTGPCQSGGLHIWDEWGTWAGKLSTLGFLSHTVQIARPASSESLPRLQTEVYIAGATRLLADLVTIAARGDDSTATAVGAPRS